MIYGNRNKSREILRTYLAGTLALAILFFISVAAYRAGIFGKTSAGVSHSDSSGEFLSDSVSYSSSSGDPAKSANTSSADFVSIVSSGPSTAASGESAPSVTTSAPANITSAPAENSPTPTMKPPSPTSTNPPTPTASNSPTPTTSGSGAIIIDHHYTKLADIPASYVTSAKSQLHIAYGHTSHGSQLIDGMSGLIGFKGHAYDYNSGGSDGALDLRNTPFSGAEDLGNPDFNAWVNATRNYLNSDNTVNVVMWSWCGQVSGASASDISGYLSRMSTLENEFPGVRFVYFTGHLDGSGLEGNLHLRNEQIRTYCRNNNKILYDFEDIESYDPDGTYFGDKTPDDACNYDSDNNGSNDKNWAQDWQNSHAENISWYNCSSAHSEPLNANQKAYAAWALFARLSGWNGN